MLQTRIQVAVHVCYQVSKSLWGSLHLTPILLLVFLADARALVTQRHAIDYRSFGAVAAGLNYVPVLNWLLGLSNTVGAALLAADMEKKQVPLFVATS